MRNTGCQSDRYVLNAVSGISARARDVTDQFGG